jgi:acid phosphatase (class A)
MRYLILGTAALALICTAGASKTPLLLGDNDLNVALVLPPPPAEGSAEALDERAELHRIDAARTPEAFESAKHDDDTKDASIFAGVLGPKFDLTQLPKTDALFTQLRAEEKAAAKSGKAFFARKRPWIGDDSLHPCSTDDEPNTSYPSGHATMGYSFAAIMARLVPDKAQALMARAASYGRARLICESHFRSDVAAGQTLGLVVAERLMEKPAFRKMYDASAKELRAKGF